MTITDKIKPDIEELKQMNIAELTAYGKEHFDSRSGFSAYKKALKQLGIDYNAMRIARRLERKNHVSDISHNEIILVTDATTERFAICNEKGDPVWFGRFFDNEGGEQSAGELAAAKKAIWLAGKIKESIGLEAITLHLQTDAQWLCWGEFKANDKRGGKARVLGELAIKYNVDLHIEHIRGAGNPADYYSRARGFKKWQDNDLASLVSQV